jgi:hypothetical protein
MLHNIELTLPRLDLFFTFWAITAHILSVMGVFYNTVGLAIFVCIGGEIINYTINEQFSLPYNILSHYLPLFIVLGTLPFKIDIRPIIILITLYTIYVRFDFASVLKYYRRPQIYVFDKPCVITLRW